LQLEALRFFKARFLYLTTRLPFGKVATSNGGPLIGDTVFYYSNKAFSILQLALG